MKFVSLDEPVHSTVLAELRTAYKGLSTHAMEDETLVKAFETYKKKDSSKGT